MYSYVGKSMTFTQNNWKGKDLSVLMPCTMFSRALIVAHFRSSLVVDLQYLY